MKNNHKWTDEERAIIRRDYKHTTESCQRIADYLSRHTGERITENAVKGQVQVMGIAKSDDRHPWSPEEDARLRELIPSLCPRAVALKMHRSRNSVVVRSKRLNISRRCRNGWFTKREVMQFSAMTTSGFSGASTPERSPPPIIMEPGQASWAVPPGTLQRRT